MPDLKEILDLLVSKLLSWAGNKQRERMLLFLEHVFQYLRYAWDSSVAFIVRNYFRLHLLALLYSILGFPIIIATFLYLGIANLWLLAIVTFIPILLPLLIEYLWSYVADGNPHDYLKVLELKSRGIYKYLASIIAGYFLSIILLYFSLLLNNVDLIIAFLLGFVAMTFAFVGFVIFMSVTFTVGNLAALRNPESYLRTTGRVCLSIVAEKRDLKVGISTCKMGLDYLNEYTKYKFKLGLANFSRYCNFFKFIALFGTEKEQNSIRLALQNLIFLMRNELELSDVILATGNLMGKQFPRSEDIFEELDFDTIISKRIAKSLDVGTVLGIIGTVPTIIVLLQVFWNVLNGLPVTISFGG